MKKVIGWVLFVVVIIILRMTVFSSTIEVPSGGGPDTSDRIVTGIIMGSLFLLVFFYIYFKIRDNKIRKASTKAYKERLHEQEEREIDRIPNLNPAVRKAVSELYKAAKK